MVATMETLSSLLLEFNTSQRVKGSAVVSRDGLPVVTALPPNVNRETFSAMAATMLAAAETAASEMATGDAARIAVEVGPVRLVAVSAGPDMLVIVIAAATADFAKLTEHAFVLAEKVRKHL